MREATRSRIQKTLTAAAWVAAMALAAACVAPLPDVASDEGSAGTGGSGGEAGAGAGAGGEGGTGGDGTCAPSCSVGDPCASDGDCASGHCAAATHACVIDGCHDQTKNGDETATDWGGACGATCAIGDPCNGPDDCGSCNCVTGRCADSGLPYCQLDSDTATLDNCQLE